ncbi:maternal B9.10 protein-like isoform X1 [Seriola lalandi dorsalis]|uniref:B-cell translocation gene 4 n=1 Tax=Seriola lalandi dorsalis TaxID=1841481 RepID=A0A3B4WDI0_SERLL|nr:maternal B9.10 protein-like isoform X1 [Seriola lalandi dorsalis]XP_056253632.1 protein BTG4 [Seriola aureovittata]
MKEEIAAAVFFVARLVKRYGCLDNDSRERFAAALTSVLFESYKNHWYPNAPTKGQAYRCLRMNRVQLQDPVLQQACERSEVSYEDLGIPREVTVWVDPGEVSCRYGEHSTPFCVSVVDSCRRGDGEFSRRIHDAVERASLDIQSGSSSDEEDGGGDNSMSSGNVGPSAVCPAPVLPTNPEPKTIPTVSNPNSVYRFVEFSSGAPQTWLWEKRKAFAGDTFPPHAPPAGGPTSQFSSQKGFKSHRATFTFSGPRVDKYHWISKSRS